MMKAIAVLKKLNRREDSEHKQALLRLGIVGAAILYTAIMNGIDLQAMNYAQFMIAMTQLVSATFSLGLLYHIINHAKINLFRRTLGMAHDVAVVTVFFYYGGEMASLFLFVYPFSAIGNGFRYGRKWLLISATMGATGLAVLLGTSEYWAKMSYASAGLVFNFVIILTYTGLLLRKVRSATDKLEELATHDSLTGLPNRQLIMSQLRHTLEFNVKSRLTLACVHFDLDGFKHVNDTLGHGDTWPLARYRFDGTTWRRRIHHGA